MLPQPKVLARLLGAAAPAWLMAACVTVGPDFATPAANVAEHWTAAADETLALPGPIDAEHWWSQLHDPDLTRLEEMALRNSPTLQLAGERVLQASAQLGQLTGEQYPQQQFLSGNLNRVHQSVHAAGYVPKSPVDLSEAQVSFTVSWEIDFWGKYRRLIQSGRASLEASQAAYDGAAVMLTAQVASAYISIRTYEAQLVVARENIDSQSEGLSLAQARFSEGESSELDVRQASTQLAETQAQLPTLEANVRQARDALAVLLGATPLEVDGLFAPQGPIPEIDPHIASGIPHDLLRQRPDVRQAEMSAAAQSAEIGVAKSALYPSFSLTGSFGYAASDVGHSSLGQLFQWDSRALQLGPSFTFPVFNYGRLEAQVRVQDALFRQAVLNYQNVVLQAQQEVEDARASLSGSVRSVEKLAAAATAARRGTELAIIQYREGATDYTTVLAAQQSQLRVESELTSARGAVPLAAVSLYRALGGGWQQLPALA